MLQQNGLVPPPHLVVVTPGQYIKEQKSFEAAEPKARDKLLPKGYNYCRCEEYHVGQCVCVEILHLYICRRNVCHTCVCTMVLNNYTGTCIQSCLMPFIRILGQHFTLYLECTSISNIRFLLLYAECVLGEDRFYILTPIDIILAQVKHVSISTNF